MLVIIAIFAYDWPSQGRGELAAKAKDCQMSAHIFLDNIKPIPAQGVHMITIRRRDETLPYENVNNTPTHC